MKNKFLQIIKFLNGIALDIENYISKRNDILFEIQEIAKDYPDICDQVNTLLLEINLCVLYSLKYMFDENVYFVL